MIVLFIDEDTVRLKENYDYFVDRCNIIFVSARNCNVSEILGIADDIVIYYSDSMRNLQLYSISEVKSVCRNNIHILYDEKKTKNITVEMLRYCLGAKSINRELKREELYDYLKKERKANAFGSDIEAYIDTAMKKCGIPSSLTGYKYIKAALCFRHNSGEPKISMTKVLYPALAKSFRTSPEGVERSIRTAVDAGYKANIGLYKRLFYSSDDARPTNSRFLKRLYDYVIFGV